MGGTVSCKSVTPSRIEENNKYVVVIISVNCSHGTSAKFLL